MNDAAATAEQKRVRADDVVVAYLAVLEQLPPEARTAFVLRAIYGVGYDQIAQVTGKSEAECRTLVQRAKAQLRNERPVRVPSRDP